MSAKRRSQREWEEIVRAFERSGLSQGEFCKRRKLSTETFGWWRWRLGKGAPPAETPEFVEVAVVGAAGCRPVTIEFAGAVVVRVERGFDEETLRRVVAVLAGERAC